MKISLSSRHLAAAVGVLLPLLAPQGADAQSKTTIRDRARQEAVREAVTDESRFSVLDGVVTDSLLRPLNSADVTVVGTGAKVVTSENGRFRMLQVPPGQYLLIVRRIGYAPTSGMIEVPARDTVRLSYVLERSSNMLDTMRIRGTRVTVRMREFDQRRRLGIGQFITQEEIERRGSLATSDFLRYMRGVQVSQVTTDFFAGTQVYSRREGAGMSDGVGAQCAMQVLLDGIILPKNFNLDLLPPPKQVAGIEVYSGAATIPPQFGGPDRRCGVVAVWTRDGYY
ncbi:MAG TPA: TonB-dependent receptor [Gemmatimonas sp.]|uniref:TonB-dependent receptor n=1 Tax=Gemmatimonas sp. TaxID=1962908 RepID=UPI002EDA952D